MSQYLSEQGFKFVSWGVDDVPKPGALGLPHCELIKLECGWYYPAEAKAAFGGEGRLTRNSGEWLVQFPPELYSVAKDKPISVDFEAMVARYDLERAVKEALDNFLPEFKGPELLSGEVWGVSECGQILLTVHVRNNCIDLAVAQIG